MEDVLPDRLLLDAVDKLPDDLERNIRLEQRHPHLAQRQLDVFLGQPPLAAEPLEDAVQLFR